MASSLSLGKKLRNLSALLLVSIGVCMSATKPTTNLTKTAADEYCFNSRQWQDKDIGAD